MPEAQYNLRLDQLYKALSESNRAIARSANEQELFNSICESILHAGFKMVWVGMIEGTRIKPIAWAGSGLEYLDDIYVSINPDEPEAYGPAGTAIRMNSPVWCQDFLHDERTAPWQENAKKHGWLSGGAVPIKKRGIIIGVLVMYSDKQDDFSELRQSLLINMAEDISYALDNLANQHQLKRVLTQTINLATTISELRDPYTSGHMFRVGELAAAIAIELKLPQHQVEGVRIGGYLHDIGKISIPSEILGKPTKLTPIEFILIKEHTRFGHEILKHVDFPWPIADIALSHHERLDGSGYPYGIKAKDISLEVRIVAIADIVEAMASHRPYRPAKGIEIALDEIKRGAGKEYDLRVVKACLRVFKKGSFVLDLTKHK